MLKVVVLSEGETKLQSQFSPPHLPSVHDAATTVLHSMNDVFNLVFTIH